MTDDEIIEAVDSAEVPSYQMFSGLNPNMSNLNVE